MGQIEPESPNHHHYAVDTTRVNVTMALRFTEILNKDLGCVEGLGLIGDLAEKEALPGELGVSVRTFLNQHITCWVEVCIRTETYISVSLFPEWAKLSVDRCSKEDIHPLIQVLDEVRANEAFFSRFQEVVSLHKLGCHFEVLPLPVIEESVKLWHELVAVHLTSYTPDLARSLRGLRVPLGNMGCHSKVLLVIKESMKLWHKLLAVHPTSYSPDLAQSS
ncbi:uncharacterized protein EI90DRAFT_3121796 [Cantharellus anzutake]|uniref:uncharacterized protein n=1 Tax=Cantharellus anzutake TaxID=1750568 RepID=UPI0019081947|nr:uncharacterized protein EI90DRAFT_3121796 [Cantharellus anzutake]KAF8333473.1 hypothetical protein EI90DRAFT_3121796 [Cantharellus anzutake]